MLSSGKFRIEHGGSLNGQVNQLGPPQSATRQVRLPAVANEIRRSAARAVVSTRHRNVTTAVFTCFGRIVRVARDPSAQHQRATQAQVRLSCGLENPKLGSGRPGCEVFRLRCRALNEPLTRVKLPYRPSGNQQTRRSSSLDLAKLTKSR